MRSAHSVSLQIYVFPFTCFAFSLFFCHFVSPSPFLLPSRAPHCAASSRSVSPWSTRGDRRSVSVADKRLAPRSMCPLAGGTCILLTRMSTSERRVGEGRFFFVSPPCLLFPLFYICLAACATLACNCTRGVLALCVQCFVDASALRRSLERCRREQRVGVGATAENTGATARKRGRFLHRLPRSPSRAKPVACRRTVSSSCAGELSSARRERDECRAKT